MDTPTDILKSLLTGGSGVHVRLKGSLQCLNREGVVVTGIQRTIDHRDAKETTKVVVERTVRGCRQQDTGGRGGGREDTKHLGSTARPFPLPSPTSPPNDTRLP